MRWPDTLMASQLRSHSRALLHDTIAVWRILCRLPQKHAEVVFLGCDAPVLLTPTHSARSTRCPARAVKRVVLVTPITLNHCA